MTGSELNFGQLKGDEEFVNTVLHFQNTLKKIENDLTILSDTSLYDSLNINDKVQYDLYISYCLNSLFWMFLRTKGEDPNKHGVKAELARVRDYMLKNKEVIERTTLRPRVNQEVAKRFLRSGLWEPKDTKKRQIDINDANTQRPNKITKFDEDS